ncbi:MAG: potassium-transporting ATPase subunit KdpC [Blastocatellia bacterium]|nr:potassium-transporting ATPase subunit KdpC [Blastocatellia bacterium]
MSWLKQIYTAVMAIVVFTIITGLIYPLVVTLLAQALFNDQANGSLIKKDGQIVGSRLIGQSFSSNEYFYSRPSAAGVGYDATSSGGTNWGPTNHLLIDRVKVNATSLKKENPNSLIPVDLVTASASGLDPDISPASAHFQISRVARARNVSEQQIKDLVTKHTKARQFNILGENRVNVLELNLDLDATYPVKKQ